MVGRIDTAGDPLFTIREGFPHESISGLAIYSKFQPQLSGETWDDIPWRFTDTGTGVFGGKLEYRVIGTIHRDH